LRLRGKIVLSMVKVDSVTLTEVEECQYDMLPEGKPEQK
jgi:hypothetical protein